jgi:probable HAF family extracellular repeat protein
MKRISILACILGVSLVSAAWAQQPAGKAPIGMRLLHRMANQTSKTPGVTVSRSVNAQANPYDVGKVWELGTYPGGTWFSSWRLNDLGVIVGRGDVPPIGANGVGYTHTLAVPLFGRHAGEWIDLGTLGGEEPKGWEEPNNDISNTGLVVSRSTAPDGQVHGVAWTKDTGMIDLGTLADTNNLEYSSYTSSMATGTNKLGTMIVGQSWSGLDPATTGVPVVWTPSNVWMSGKFVTKWKIQNLDTTAFPDLTGFVAWGVNDYGLIIGTGWNSDFTTTIGALWTPRADGKGWDLTSLPPSPAFPSAQVWGINDRGEIVGVATSTDQNIWLPRLWQPLDREGRTYSQPIELPLPNGGFTNCEAVGINELGDLVGDCWGAMKDLPTRWTTEDLTFSEIINFPGNVGFSWGVNNNRIASVTYLGGKNCPSNTYGSCGGAVQLH